MQTAKRADQIKSLIKSELIRLLKEDEVFRQYVIEITTEKYAEKKKTEDRIDKILDELRADRERQDKKWEENQKIWNARWEENQKRWEENQRVINEMLASIKSLDRRLESGIGALGARWGLHSEASFRNGLKAILEESFNVKVERYQDYDEQGIVFGQPDQVELDVIIYNESLILCEIKSSMSKSDMYAFWRKKEFYENRHGRKADRFIVISPMVDPKAQKVAQELGIEFYSFPEQVEMGE
jgi:hypothetical protein